MGVRRLIQVEGVIRCSRKRSQSICDLVAARLGAVALLFDKWLLVES